MSALAFYASPFEDSPPSAAAAQGQDRKKISRGKTIKKRPNPHVAAMIQHIHESTGTKPEDGEGDSPDMGEFKPPAPPRSGRSEESSAPTEVPPPKPYAGEDAPVGPVTVEGFENGGPGPGHHASAHPYVPYYTAAAGSGPHLGHTVDIHSDEQQRRDGLMKKLDYMIHLLEEQHDERTGHVTEEVILYSFLGVFVIFVVDSFARAGKYVR